MPPQNNFLLVLKSSALGEGSQDLGETLLSKFLSVLFESGNLPARIICMNSAIFLTTQGSKVAETLNKFETSGTEILSCSTCLEYYDRIDKLIAGKATNMKDMVASMTSFEKVINL
jgi:selenium metabolism protein YedF